MQSQVSLAVKPVIDFLLGFRYRLEMGADIDLYTLRRDILNTLQAVDGILRNSPGLHSRVEVIRYLLVGFADEVILSSTWSKAKEWREKLLEMELFKTSVAGERFFDFLERDGYRDPELAEFFFTCLSLGFRGKFRSREGELQAIKQRVYAVLPHRLPDDERILTPGAGVAFTGGNKMIPRIFGISTVVIVLLVSTVGYFVASQWLWSAIAETIHAIALSLTQTP
jgi:type IV/VI secretion system ImpK/VasF family protein